jgi:cytochrome P450
LCLLLAVLALSHWYTQRHLLPGIVHFEQSPIVGNWPALLKNVMRLYDWKVEHAERAVQEHGREIVQRSGPFFGMVEVLSPRMLKHMLHDRFDSFEKGPRFRRVFQEFLGDGIFNSDGDTWRRQRKTASHMFAASKLNNYMLHTFVAHAETMLDVLEKHRLQQDDPKGTKHIDLQRLFYAYTMDSICRIGFGMALDSLKLPADAPPPPFARAFDGMQESIVFRFLGPPLKWRTQRFFKWGTERVVAESLPVINDFVYSIVQARKANAEAYKDSGDLLSLFVAQAAKAGATPKEADHSAASASTPTSAEGEAAPASASSGGGEMSDKELRDTVLNFMLAGRDTTASLLTFLFHELSVNPRVEALVRAEIAAVFGELGPEQRRSHAACVSGITHDTLKACVYLEAVILETLRLHPPVAADNKLAVADSVFPDGTHIPKGTLVSYSPYVFGRLRSIWGEDVLQFRPERFLKIDDDAVGAEGRPTLVQPSQYAFPAFNAGYRLCLGKSMALMESKTCATAILRRFTLREKEGHDPMYKITIVMSMKHGLPVTVHERDE